MTRSFRDWLAEGEAIYAETLKEYHCLEAQISELEKKLAEKKAEVNQVAQMIGKPPVDGPRRVSAQIIEPETPPPANGPIARALTGRGLVAR
ncbi:hypothetical protein [Fontivita pretiosa]|uniref:hypothetical protein n=1 Tax=Fontivita pretiosa TaxID=2989684 RepID=UPI003D17ADE2